MNKFKDYFIPFTLFISVISIILAVNILPHMVK